MSIVYYRKYNEALKIKYFPISDFVQCYSNAYCRLHCLLTEMQTNGPFSGVNLIDFL